MLFPILFLNFQNLSTRSLYFSKFEYLFLKSFLIAQYCVSRVQLILYWQRLIDFTKKCPLRHFKHLDLKSNIFITFRRNLKYPSFFHAGYFRTPFADYLPQLLPPESEKAYFQAILPLDQAKQGRLKPICSKTLSF